MLPTHKCIVRSIGHKQCTSLVHQYHVSKLPSGVEKEELCIQGRFVKIR